MNLAPIALVATLSLAALVLAAAMAPAPTAREVAAPVINSAQARSGADTVATVATAATFAVAGGTATAVPPAGGLDLVLALTDDQHLIADHALRLVMEAYLSDRRNPLRLQQLDQHLRGRLPTAAATEARALAARYDAYLTEHDALLQAQNFAADPDLHRIASWQAQRRQLRQRTLGADVSEQWFGTEDAYLEQALDERRQPANGAAAAAKAVSEDQRRHAEHMRQVVDAAIGRPQH